MEKGSTCDGRNQVIYVPSVAAKDSFDVRGDKDHDVIRSEEGNLIVFTITSYVVPIVSMSANPSYAEVGDTKTVDFTLDSDNGSSDIVSRILDPAEGLTGTTGVFSWQETGVTRNTAGDMQSHTLTVTDDSGNNPVVKTAAINFRWRIYQGFSTNSSLNASQIKALVNSHIDGDIIAKYGGSKNYTIPVYGSYIYWVFEATQTPVVAALMSELPFPLTQLAPVSVTNDFGQTTNYIAVRSTNYFDTGTLTIKIR